MNPEESPVYTYSGPPVAVPAFPLLLDGNVGPCPQPPTQVLALTLVSSGTTQTVVPVTHVANDREELIPIRDINSFGAVANEMEEVTSVHDTNSFRAVASGMEERPPNFDTSSSHVASSGLEELAPVDQAPSSRPAFMQNANCGLAPPNTHNSLVMRVSPNLHPMTMAPETPKSFHSSQEPYQLPVDRVALGSIDIEHLQDKDILFFFEVFNIMARLNPRYLFKYGGVGGEMVGMKLIFYGHTVFVDPICNSANEARLLGCKKALGLLQEDNPQWPMPPRPDSSRSSDAVWDWTKILAGERGARVSFVQHLGKKTFENDANLEMVPDFCASECWAPPLYNPGYYGSQTEWHCDVSVNGRVFRTGCSLQSPRQAENTAAHIALHTMLVQAYVPADAILPANDLSFEFKKPVVIKTEKMDETQSTDTIAVTSSMQAQAQAQSQAQVQAQAKAQADADAMADEMLEALVSSFNMRTHRGNGRGGGRPRGKRGGAKQITKNGPKPVAPKAGGTSPSKGGATPPRRSARIRASSPAGAPNRRGARAQAPGAPRGASTSEEGEIAEKNANLVPLTKSRVVPITHKAEPVEDPQARLKSMQKELGDLPTDSSYHALLTRMCAVLKVNMPEIRHEKDPSDPSPTAWMVRAWFDMQDPYLSRASPIMLDKFPKMDEKAACSLGIKHLMLYLLNMVKEDAGMELVGMSSYSSDYPFLKALEVELKQRIARGPCEK
ncbi:hypothetical protein N7466_005265 [Penicillium verhagenii]|uniref:uncharacterized protein n=1 Tax=Penicillium verhagenii TaxID=1562060 RepID=UPI0025454794|nr:uncharacterized protein N7466_005265 [Penicillium verhagenii]KAJ5935718.1 hypothetical protein N7466_005265 [Penicillium verhagenii]